MKHEEENLQIQCVRWFSIQYPQLAILLHHSPNGGRRTPLEGAKFKKMGTRAGFPDLFLYFPNAKYHGLCVELKSRKGVQQSTQKAMQLALEFAGYKYVIVRTFESFIETIKGYLCSKL